MSKWTSRKLWTAIGAEALFTFLLIQGHIEPSHYEGLTLWTFAGWFGAEASEKWAQRK